MVLTEMTVNALATATDALHGVLDKAGKPLIAHAIAVAEHMEGEIETVVALLHDVLEDSSLSRASLIMKGFPNEVVEAVVTLTRVQGESYQSYMERIRLNPVAVKVKLADLEHNCDLSRLPSVSAIDRARVNKYLEARRFLVGGMSHSC